MTDRPPHPGLILKDRFLEPLGLLPYHVAKATGVHVSRLTRLIDGERAMTPDTATRLGLYFGVPAAWWMDMQTRYDLGDPGLKARLSDKVAPLQRPAGIAIGPQGVRRFTAVQESPGQASQVAVSDELLSRLRAQAGPRDQNARRVKAVVYDNGAQAVVGADS